MIIYSEITKQKYNSVEECIEAEEVYAAMKAKEEEEKIKVEKEKDYRIKELQNAFEEMKTAMEKYAKIKEEFVKDYSYFRFIKF